MLSFERFHITGICATTTYAPAASNTANAPCRRSTAQITTPATTSHPARIIHHDAKPMGGLGFQRSHSHGPPTSDGTTARLTDRQTSRAVWAAECTPAVASDTEKKMITHTTKITASAAHNRRARTTAAASGLIVSARSASSPAPSSSPVSVRRRDAATDNVAATSATGRMNSDFSKKVSAIRKINAERTVIRRRVASSVSVRQARTASPTIQAIAACIGRVLSPAAHHVKAGTVIGVKR